MRLLTVRRLNVYEQSSFHLANSFPPPFLLQRGQPAHEILQGDGGLEPRVFGEVAVDDASHVELAHLDPVHTPEHVEQVAHTVYNNALDGVAHARYRLHGQHIVRNGLVPDEGGDVERSARGVIKRK